MSKPAKRYTGSLLIARLRHDLDRLLHEVLAATESLVHTGGWCPSTDLVETADALVVLVELPGQRATDVAVEIEGPTVRIRGRRTVRYPSGPTRFHCLERQEGTFERQIEISEPVDFSRARCALRRGVLEIELPKIEDRRRRRRGLEITECEEEDDG